MSEIKIGAGAWMGHGPCESERAFPTSRRPLLLSAGRSRHRQGISAMSACVPTTPTRRWLPGFDRLPAIRGLNWSLLLFTLDRFLSTAVRVTAPIY